LKKYTPYGVHTIVCVHAKKRPQTDLLTAKEKNEMTEIKGKISRPFAFLKFANPHTAYCQAPHPDQSPNLDKELYFTDAIFCTFAIVKY